MKYLFKMELFEQSKDGTKCTKVDLPKNFMVEYDNSEEITRLKLSEALGMPKSIKTGKTQTIVHL